MSSKTTNQDKEIATLGSLHKAITTPEATCAYKIVGSYTNYITTNECGRDQAAQRTLVRSMPVIHLESKIGVPHNGAPSHYKEIKAVPSIGVKSGKPAHTYAKAEKGSGNLLIEGKPAVRTDDPTQQAFDNSKGIMRAKEWGLNQNDLLALLKQQCSLDTLVTKCKHGREIDLARVSRLEVFAGDKVALTATRINATTVDPEQRKKPKCLLESKIVQPNPAEEKHTRFEISRGTYVPFPFRDMLPERKETKFGDVLTLDEAWFGRDIEDKKADPLKRPPREKGAFKTEGEYNPDQVVRTAPPNPNSNTPSGQYAQAVAYRERLRAGAAGGPPPLRLERDEPLILTETEARNRNAQLEGAAAARNTAQRGQDAAEGYKTTNNPLNSARRATDNLDRLRQATWSLAEVIAFLLTPAVEVKINAISCAGTRTVTIAAYPTQKQTVDLVMLKEIRERYDKVKAVLLKVGEWLSTIKTAASKLPASKLLTDFDVEILFLNQRFIMPECKWERYVYEPHILIGAQWKELQRDAGQKRLKHQVKLAWSLQLQIQRFIGVTFKYSVPLALCAGPLGTIVTWAIDQIKKRTGSEFGFYADFSIECYAGVDAQTAWDEYGTTSGQSEAKFEVKAETNVSLRIQIGSAAQVIASLVGKWEADLTARFPEDQFMVVTMIDRTSLSFKVTLAVDILGFAKEKQFDPIVIYQTPAGQPPVVIPVFPAAKK